METSSWFERWDICGTSYAPFPVELMRQASGATLSPSMPRVVALKITAHLRGLGAWKWTWPRASVETDV